LIKRLSASFESAREFPESLMAFHMEFEASMSDKRLNATFNTAFIRFLSCLQFDIKKGTYMDANMSLQVTSFGKSFPATYIRAIFERSFFSLLGATTG
jgi:hypothetical protein